MLNTLKLYVDTLGPWGAFLAILGKFFSREFQFEYIGTDNNIPITIRVPSSDTPTIKKIFIDAEYWFLCGREPDLIVDAGANIGISALYFATQFPKCKIIAIEPEKSNFILLEKNIKNYPNITAIRAALWKDDYGVSIVDPKRGKWAFRTEQATKAANLTPSYSVESLLEKFNLEKIDILKCDIEGSECEVFNASSAWIKKVGGCIVETHERYRPGSHEAFINATRDFPYLWENGENFFCSTGDCMKKH